MNSSYSSGFMHLLVDELPPGVGGKPMPGPAQVPVAEGSEHRTERRHHLHHVRLVVEGGLEAGLQRPLGVHHLLFARDPQPLRGIGTGDPVPDRHPVGLPQRDGVVDALLALLDRAFAAARSFGAPSVMSGLARGSAPLSGW